jgi:hypothetical protein
MTNSVNMGSKRSVKNSYRKTEFLNSMYLTGFCDFFVKIKVRLESGAERFYIAAVLDPSDFLLVILSFS